MDTVITSLSWERATKGTHLYKEDDVFDILTVRNIYLTKAVAEEGGEAPKKLGVIIIEMGEGESLDDCVDRFIEDRED